MAKLVFLFGFDDSFRNLMKMAAEIRIMCIAVVKRRRYSWCAAFRVCKWNEQSM